MMQKNQCVLVFMLSLAISPLMGCAQTLCDVRCSAHQAAESSGNETAASRDAASDCHGGEITSTSDGPTAAFHGSACGGESCAPVNTVSAAFLDVTAFSSHTIPVASTVSAVEFSEVTTGGALNGSKRWTLALILSSSPLRL